MRQRHISAVIWRITDTVAEAFRADVWDVLLCCLFIVPEIPDHSGTSITPPPTRKNQVKTSVCRCLGMILALS